MTWFEAMGLTISNPETAINLEEYIGEVQGLRDPDDLGFEVHAPGPRGLQNSLVASTCMHIVSETTSHLPCGVYERRNGGRIRRHDSTVELLMDGAPNPEMDAQIFRETLTGHCLSWGFGMAEVEDTPAGTPKHLWPIPPWCVFPYRDETTRRLWWIVNIEKDGKPVVKPRALDPARVLVIPWWSSDGYRFYSPLRLAAADIGLAQALDRFALKYFKDGHHMSAAVKHPKYIDPERKKELRRHIEEGHGGLDRAHRIMILDDGFDIEQLRLPLEEAKLLESRLFEWRVVAALYRIAADRVNIFERASYASLAQTDTRFAKDAIAPMARRWERPVDRRLLNRWSDPRPTPELYCRHNLQGLLRGDPLTMAKIAEIERKWGALSSDEWRARNDDDPIGGEAGGTYLIPKGSQPVSSGERIHTGPATAVKVFRVALDQATTRVLARERHGVPKVRAHDAAEQLATWYRDQGDWVLEQVTGAYRLAAEASNSSIVAVARQSALDLAAARSEATAEGADHDAVMDAFLSRQAGQLNSILEGIPCH